MKGHNNPYCFARPIYCLGTWLWLVLATSHPIALYADESDNVAMKRGADPVWYSGETKKLVPASPPTRNLIDVDDRFDKLASAIDASNSNYSWFSQFFDGLLKFIRDSWQIVLLLVLLAALTLVVFLLWKIQKFIEPKSKATQSLASLAAQQYKVTDLPFELDNPDIPLQQMIEEYRKRGDYSTAMSYLYSLMLIELDAAGLIRLAKGKTNWTYLSELGHRQEERTFATTVVYWFEHVFFGKHNMERDAFESIWTSLAPFQERLKLAQREKA